MQSFSHEIYQDILIQIPKLEEQVFKYMSETIWAYTFSFFFTESKYAEIFVSGFLLNFV